MAEDETLMHIRQRIDALTYDSNSQYLLGSLQVSDASFFINSLPRTRGSTPPITGSPTSTHEQEYPRPRRMSLTTTVTRRRNRRTPRQWARFVGLTSYYMSFLLLIGACWFLLLFGSLMFLYGVPEMASSGEIIMDDERRKSYLLICLVFLGGAVGAVLFGSFADHAGRKKPLMYAIGIWIIGNGLVACAWDFVSLVVFRSITTVGFGGQSALLITITLEFAPTRTRGRMTVLPLMMTMPGGLAAVLCGENVHDAMGWRAVSGAIAGISLLYLLIVAKWLDESPKYLASTGRMEEALRVVEAMEKAHGISRQGRVTVPTSLYEPPSVHHQRRNLSTTSGHGRTGSHRTVPDIPEPLGSSTAAYNTLKEEENYPTGRPGRQMSVNQNTGRNVQTNAGLGINNRSHRVSTDRYAAASPAMLLSIKDSFRKRSAILFRRPYAQRTLLLWFVWYLGAGAFATTLASLTVTMDVYNSNSSAAVVWSAMILPGFLIAAILVEQMGRKRTLALLMCVAGTINLLIATLFTPDSNWTVFLIAVGVLLITLAGAFGALAAYTGEQFAVMVRAMGVACAWAWGLLGIGTGVYLLLTRTAPANDDEEQQNVVHWNWEDEQILLYVFGGACWLMMACVLLVGVETRGNNVDTINDPSLQTSEEDEDEDRLGNHRLGRRRTHHSRLRHLREEEEESSDGATLNRTDQQRLKRGRRGSVTVPSTPFSPSESESEMSSSSSSGYWQTKKRRSMSHFKMQVKRALAASGSSSTLPGTPGKSRTNKIISVRKMTSRTTALSGEDLDQLDEMVISDLEESKHSHLPPPPVHSGSRDISEPSSFSSNNSNSSLGHQVISNRTNSDPIIVEWRLSNQASPDDKSLVAGEDEDTDGRLSIDLEMFDTFTYISTPVLGETNITKMPPQPPSY